MLTDYTLANTAYNAFEKPDWKEQKAYKIHLMVTKDDEGVFSAVALNLPGAGSSGDTEDDAINNAREAIAAVIDDYLSSGEQIPWRNSAVGTEIPFGGEEKWIVINA